MQMAYCNYSYLDSSSAKNLPSFKRVGNWVRYAITKLDPPLPRISKFHRTLSRMQKASQSVGKTSKPDGRVIFTPQKWIKNQIYNPCTRSWHRIETCRFLTPVKETSEHMRSPYSTPHIYGLERAISSPGVPFVVRH